MSNTYHQDTFPNLLGYARILSSQSQGVTIEILNSSSSSSSSSSYYLQKADIISNGFTYDDSYLQPNQILQLYTDQDNYIRAHLRDISIHQGEITGYSMDKFSMNYTYRGNKTKMIDIPIIKLEYPKPIDIGIQLKVYISTDRVIGFTVIQSQTPLIQPLPLDIPKSVSARSTISPIMTDDRNTQESFQITKRRNQEMQDRTMNSLAKFSKKLQKSHLKLMKLISKSIKNRTELDLTEFSLAMSKTPVISDYPELASIALSRSFMYRNKKIAKKIKTMKELTDNLRKCQVCNRMTKEFRLGCGHFICGDDLREHLRESTELNVYDSDYSYSITAPCRLCSYNLTELELKTIMGSEIERTIKLMIENCKKQNQTQTQNMGIIQCAKCLQRKQSQEFEYSKYCSCVMCLDCFRRTRSSYICDLCYSKSPSNIPAPSVTNHGYSIPSQVTQQPNQPSSIQQAGYSYLYTPISNSSQSTQKNEQSGYTNLYTPISNPSQSIPQNEQAGYSNLYTPIPNPSQRTQQTDYSNSYTLPRSTVPTPTFENFWMQTVMTDITFPAHLAGEYDSLYTKPIVSSSQSMHLDSCSHEVNSSVLTKYIIYSLVSYNITRAGIFCPIEKCNEIINDSDIAEVLKKEPKYLNLYTNLIIQLNQETVVSPPCNQIETYKNIPSEYNPHEVVSRVCSSEDLLQEMLQLDEVIPCPECKTPYFISHNIMVCMKPDCRYVLY